MASDWSSELHAVEVMSLAVKLSVYRHSVLTCLVLCKCIEIMAAYFLVERQHKSSTNGLPARFIAGKGLMYLETYV